MFDGAGGETSFAALFYSTVAYSACIGCVYKFTFMWWNFFHGIDAVLFRLVERRRHLYVPVVAFLNGEPLQKLQKGLILVL